MLFYSIIGFILSIYLWFVILWNIGDGFNEFNKKKGTLRIVRQGFPGKNRRIQMVYFLKDITCIRLEQNKTLTSTALGSTSRVIYIQLKNKVKIPLTQIGQPLSLEEIEEKGAMLSSFLQVPLQYFTKSQTYFLK